MTNHVYPLLEMRPRGATKAEIQTLIESGRDIAGNNSFVINSRDSAGPLTAANTLQVRNNGVAQMTIVGTGFVGIGTTTPAAELDVNAGTINAAQICDENNANCLDLSAGVGGDNLGNHTMTQSIDMGVDTNWINGDSDANEGYRVTNEGLGWLRFSAGNSTPRGQYIQNQSTTVGTGAGIWMASGSSSNNGARIGTNYQGSNSSDLTFEVGESNTLNERMRLTSDGRLGVGTTDPAAVLHVANPSAPGEILLTDNDSGRTMTLTGDNVPTINTNFIWLTLDSVENGVQIGPSTGFGTNSRFTINGFGGTHTSYLSISTDNANANEGDILFIDGSGQMGIGTTSPAVALDVHTGTINAAQICDENNANCQDLSAGSGGGGDITDGGNSTGATVVVGTNDNQDFEIESNGSTRVRFDNSGQVYFGGGSLYGGNVKYQFASNPWSETGDFVQINNDSYFNGAPSNTGTVAAALNYARVNKSGGSMNNVYGAHNLTVHFDSGTMANGVGSYNEVIQNATAGGTDKVGTFSYVDVNNGTLTNAYGSRVQIDNASTITNAYGFYVADLPATNNWGIYQVGSDDNNFFAGDVGIGTNNPAVELDVNTGTINAAEICDENNANCLDLSAGTPDMSCPASFTKVGEMGCIQDDENGSATWFVAVNTCFTSHNGRLPTIAEWYIAMNNNALSNETDDWEWTSNSGSSANAIRMGNGGLTNEDGRNKSNSETYRCWIPLPR